MLSLPLLAGDSELVMAAPVASAPYLDITRDVAAAFGLQWEHEAGPDGFRFRIPGDQRPRAAAFAVEGDWSTAAFPLVAGAIAGGPVRVEGVDAASSQGDRAILDVLRAFGADVAVDAHAVEVAADGLTTPGAVDVAATPDMFPALCVLASQASGTTTITGGAALRHKESDRIAAMVAGLRSLGARIEATPDGARIHGTPGALHGATVHAHDDHRIHMALCLAGLVADGNTVVDGAPSAAVSYPGFHTDLARLQEGA